MPGGTQPSQSLRTSAIVFWGTAAVAIVLRLIVAQWPGNFDFESWNIVADITLGGKNVYAGTGRYNYGPVWAGIVGVLKALSAEHFRIALCLVLSAVDIGIALFLRKHANLVVAIAFLLAPWTILISGHHGQFDNIAILLGLLAIGFASTRTGYAQRGLAGLSLRQTLMAASLLGLSLVVKHVLFLLPVWMAFRVPEMRRRLLWLGVPFIIFGASFLPFWAEGRDGIVANVLRYNTDQGAPFLNTFGPAVVDMLLGCQPHHRIERLFFYSALLLAGALLRRRSLLELLAFYTAFLVVFSPGIWNHYLAIPVIFTVLFRNGWSIAYQLLALPYYILHHDGFNYGRGWAASSASRTVQWYALESWGHHVFVGLLVFAVVRVLWGERLRSAGARIVQRLGEAIRGCA